MIGFSDWRFYFCFIGERAGTVEGRISSSFLTTEQRVTRVRFFPTPKPVQVISATKRSKAIERLCACTHVRLSVRLCVCVCDTVWRILGRHIIVYPSVNEAILVPFQTPAVQCHKEIGHLPFNVAF